MENVFDDQVSRNKLSKELEQFKNDSITQKIEDEIRV